MTRLFSQMSWLGQHNAELVLKNIDANTKMTDLGARQQALEEKLAWAAGERDVQRVAVEQKAQEAKAQAAELQHLRTALEQKEAELLQKEVTVVMLTGTLREMGKALEEKEATIRSTEATLQEKENSLSSLEETARVQWEGAQKSIVGKYPRVFIIVGLFLFPAYVDPSAQS